MNVKKERNQTKVSMVPKISQRRLKVLAKFGLWSVKDTWGSLRIILKNINRMHSF